MRKLTATLAICGLLAFGGPAVADMLDVEQDGLVNVNIGDITILENVQLAVAANIAAGICANVDVDAALAVIGAVDFDSVTRQVCEIDRRGGPQFIAIEQNN
jgi:hypothetical protein